MQTFSLTKDSLRVGFELTREDPIGFQVQRLNHSAITAMFRQEQKRYIKKQRKNKLDEVNDDILHLTTHNCRIICPVQI